MAVGDGSRRNKAAAHDDAARAGFARAVVNKAMACTRLARRPVASFRTDYNTKFLMASRRFDRLAFPTNNRDFAVGRVISRASSHWTFPLTGCGFSRFVARISWS